MRFFSYFFIISVVFLSSCNSPHIKLLVTQDRELLDDNESAYTTIDVALGAIEDLRREGNLVPATIHIQQGEYRLSSPLKIGANHGSVQLIGEGSDNTILKGSIEAILEWEKYDQEIWQAKINGTNTIDQLFINGQKQILARYPNYDEDGGHWQGHAKDAIAPERVTSWKNPKGALVHAMHSGEWGGFHFVVDGVDENGDLILTGGHQNNRPSEMHGKYRMVENVFEELDSPGEWYLGEDSILYYWPSKGVDIESATVELVEQKHLIEIKGTEEEPAKDITIRGIGFEHTKRTINEAYEPLLRSDWTIYRGGALFLENTQHITIQECEFTNLGGNVIFVSNYNDQVAIRDNHIHDCGASAISFVGNPSAVRSPSFQYSEFVPLAEIDTIKGPKSDAYPRNSLVDNNLIYRIGRLEKQTAGVELAMAMNITISNNSIYEVPRAGINIGDGTWGGHIIEFNDVFSTVLESGDHGAFNSWGRDRFWHPNRETMDEIVASIPNMPTWDAIHTTVIRNNRFRCDHGWDIDLDDGSSNYHIYNNICLNGGLKFREGFNRTAENNILINNGFHPHVWFKNSNDVFRHNIVFTEHRDIRLQGWGKEVDQNFFPDEEALEKVQAKGVDANSIFGDPLFTDPNAGNFAPKAESKVFDIGFSSFEADNFGVKNKKLRALAKTPKIPKLFFGVAGTGSTTYNWLGTELKNIVSMAERSASGLNKTAGVIILRVDENSLAQKAGIKINDVILHCEGEEVNNISDLMRSYQKNNWHGKLNLKIFRNQKEISITLSTK